MISFKPLQKVLERNGRTKTWLKTSKIIGGGTYTAIAQGMKEPIEKGVALDAINRICEALQCQPGDIMEWIPDSTENAEDTEEV